MWLCVCDCGNEIVTRRGSLVGGQTNSCGCIRRELARAKGVTHGHSKKREHLAWRTMLDRCYNPTEVGFHNYGGRGIGVCKRWRDSFEAFLADVGPRPSPAHSLDRIDNDGHYEPGNVRWATRVQQGRNRSTNRHLTLHGVTMAVCEWAERVGISREAIHNRLADGWSVERTLTTPIRPKRPARTRH